MKLRNYQEEAVAGVFTEWEKVQSTLGQAATGGGKTQIFCEVIRRRPGRALILAHRTELVSQAVNRLDSFGLDAEIEQGQLAASTSLWSNRVVVATPQTLYHNKFARLQRFGPDTFDTIICDEAHHYSGAPAFEGVVRHFMQNEKVRILGVTATSDRADNIAMARVFQSVAFNIEIKYLIELGYLVPIEQQMVKIKSLDYSECNVVAGELSSADVDRVMEYEGNILGMADATLQVIGDRRTAVFAKTVEQATRFAEIFNRHKSGCADCVFGHTPAEDRRRILQKFSEGKLQICVNVGVLTEGYDNPGIEAVVMARPTLSRALYAQMAGRGTRPLAGVVDAVLIDDANARRQAIAASPKPTLMILDFVDNSNRHKLVSAVDILGGKMSEEAKDRARKKVVVNGRGNVLDELTIAEQELREEEEAKKRAGIKPKAEITLHYVDPFDMFKARARKWKNFRQTKPLSPKQCSNLSKHGWDPSKLTPEEGQNVLNELFSVTPKQSRVLIRAGYSLEELQGIRKWEASKMIAECSKNGWKRPKQEAPPF